MNRKIVLKQRPNGFLSEENFALVQQEIRALHDGEVLIQSKFLSVDPYMRERMTPMKSYIAPFELNEAITGTMVGQIKESKHPDFAPGEVVTGFLKWQDFQVSDGKQIKKVKHKPYQSILGVLGSPGLTAYFGLLDAGKPKKSDTVVVSGAGGAVGTMVGQIAKIYGCRVVGITGSDEKNEYLLNELGFDSAINYKTEQDLGKALEMACPNGIDVYFDNVGNEFINTITSCINKRARIVLCGQISQYNGDSPYVDPKIFGRITKSSATVQGFLISEYSAAQSEEARKQIASWIEEGKMKYRETILDGFEQAPKALVNLFNGKNIGKQLVRI
jgi:NADPH:quinone reductase